MKVCVYTLGCKVNQYESGEIIARLRECGHEATAKLESADIFIVNTCAVTNEAEKKSRQIVSKITRNYPKAKIVVCGCSSQREAKQYDKEGRLISGAFGKTQLYRKLEEVGVRIAPQSDTYEDAPPVATDRARSYLKIQDGCNHFCSYCIVPYLRGRSRSRNMESILAEAHSMEGDACEVVLTGVDISDYRAGEKRLIDVIEALAEKPYRIRLGSLEVSIITEEFLERVLSVPNFCPHFHLSLQSGSSGVLKRMNRNYTAEAFLRKIEMIRSVYPYPGITTDIIVGFPEETETEFKESLAFAEKAKFSDIHVFAYSKREGTKAAEMKQTPHAEIVRREAAFLKLKEKLKRAFAEENTGRTHEILIEEKQGDYVTGYTRNYLRAYMRGDFCAGDTVDGVCRAPLKDGALFE